jgi:FG-GAP-like repeat
MKRSFSLLPMNLIRSHICHLPAFVALTALTTLISQANPLLTRPYGFGPIIDWGTITNTQASQIVLAGDVTGDGLPDLVIFSRSGTPARLGDVYVKRNTGQAFGPDERWHDSFCIGSEVPALGDLNGDGVMDIISFDLSTGLVWRADSTRSSFGGSAILAQSFAGPQHLPLVGDVDGDGHADLVKFIQGQGATTSTPLVAFYQPSIGSVGSNVYALASEGFAPEGTLPRLADLTGTHHANPVCFFRSSSAATAGHVTVSLNCFQNQAPCGPTAAAALWHTFFCLGQEVPLIGDFTGDGADDVVTLVPTAMGGPVFGARNVQTAFLGTGELWHRDFARLGDQFLASRCNADLNTDLVRISPTGGISVVLAGGYGRPLPLNMAQNFGHGTMTAGGMEPGRPALGDRDLILAITTYTDAAALIKHRHVAQCRGSDRHPLRNNR